MRTTVDLPEDVLEVARSLAAAKHLSIGNALAELVRRGLAAKVPIAASTLFPTFQVSDDAPPITMEMVRLLEDES